MTEDPGYRRRDHEEIVEALRRISTGIEELVRQNDRLIDQQRDLVARFEAALKFAIRTWQETPPRRKS